MVQCGHCYTKCPQVCSRSPQTHASAGDSWTLPGKSGSVFCGVTAPFFWVLVCIRFCLCPPRVCCPVLCKFWRLHAGVNGDLLQEGLRHTQVFCTQGPYPCSRPLLTHTSTGDTQTLRGRSRSVTAKSQKVLSESSEHLWWVWGLILTMISPLLPYCLGFSFALGCEVYFFGGIQHSPVDSCPAVSCFPSPRVPRVL